MAVMATFDRHGAMLLEFALVLVVALAGLELGFFSSTLWYLLRGPASASFHFYTGAPDSPFYVLSGTPAHFLLGPGYVAAGAAGAAFLLVGLGGLLALALRDRSRQHDDDDDDDGARPPPWPLPRGAARALGRACYRAWLAVLVPAALLTTAALGCVFVATGARAGQQIRLDVATRLNGTAPYDFDSWTPQDWFPAVLGLALVENRGDVQAALSIMRGWQWTLVPLLLVQAAAAALALAEWRRGRGRRKSLDHRHSRGY